MVVLQIMVVLQVVFQIVFVALYLFSLTQLPIPNLPDEAQKPVAPRHRTLSLLVEC